MTSTGAVPQKRTADSVFYELTRSISVRSMVVGEARLAATFPLLARHPQWIADSEGHPVRSPWLEALQRWGFIK